MLKLDLAVYYHVLAVVRTAVVLETERTERGYGSVSLVGIPA